MDQRAEPFRTCTVCGRTWADLRDFVEDRELTINGYMPSFDEPEEGMILFTHAADGCGTSFGVKVLQLEPVHRGTRFEELRFLSDECEGRCIVETDLDPCSAHCRMAWIREMIQVLQRHDTSALEAAP